MKTFTLATVAAMAAVGTAQLNNIPSCALSCFVPALTSDGCSSLTDFKCHCEKGASLIATVQPCVQGACSAADQATAIQAVQTTCEGVGVPINIPSAPEVSSAAAPAVSSAAAVASSAAAVASSAAEAASSVVASALSSLVSAAPSATSAVASGASAAPSSAVSQFTGAAAQATQAAGLLGAAALAMLAL